MYCPFRHLNDGSFGICYGSGCMAYRQWDNNLTTLYAFHPDNGEIVETIHSSNEPDVQCYCALMFANPATINYKGACV